MDNRLYFVLGDLLSNIVIGALVGTLAVIVVGTGWNMWLAMLLMMTVMSWLTEIVGPSMDRQTVENVEKAGFSIVEVEHVFLDVVKIIKARAPR